MLLDLPMLKIYIALLILLYMHVFLYPSTQLHILCTLLLYSQGTFNIHWPAPPFISAACTFEVEQGFEMEARTVTASVCVILLTLVGTGTSNRCFNSEGKYDL